MSFNSQALPVMHSYSRFIDAATATLRDVLNAKPDAPLQKVADPVFPEIAPVSLYEYQHAAFMFTMRWRALQHERHMATIYGEK